MASLKLPGWWRDNTPVCAWAGTSCTEGSDTVTEIDMTGWNLTGGSHHHKLSRPAVHVLLLTPLPASQILVSAGRTAPSATDRLSAAALEGLSPAEIARQPCRKSRPHSDGVCVCTLGQPCARANIPGLLLCLQCCLVYASPQQANDLEDAAGPWGAVT